MTFPVPGHLTSLSAQMSILAFASSPQMIAVARSGLAESALSLLSSYRAASHLMGTDNLNFADQATASGVTDAPHGMVVLNKTPNPCMSLSMATNNFRFADQAIRHERCSLWYSCGEKDTKNTHVVECTNN